MMVPKEVRGAGIGSTEVANRAPLGNGYEDFERKRIDCGFDA